MLPVCALGLRRMSDWLEAERRVERAQQLSESARWAEALVELEAAIAINPNNALWHAQRGFILEELDRTEDALAAYESSLSLEPGDRDVLMAFGAALTRQGRYARALSVFEEVARQSPDFEPAYCLSIQVYAELGLHDRAEEMFYLAQELDDACPHCIFHMGISLTARDLPDRAIFCWRRVLELDPGYLGVNRRIGQAYRRKGDLKLARKFLMRELREDPGNPDLLFELAELAWASGKRNAAAAKFTQLLELEPDHREARIALGRLCLERGKPERALALFERAEAAGLSEQGPELDWRIGEALAQLKRWDEARRRLEAASARDPENVSIWLTLGSVLRASGRTADAADCFRRVLARDATCVPAQRELAASHLAMNRPDAALVHCRQLLASDADDPIAQYLSAIAHMLAGRWSEAKTCLRACVRIDAQNVEARRLLGRLWKLRLRHFLSRILSRR